MVPCFIQVPQKDTEIQQSLVQPLAYVHGIAADNVEMDARMALPQLLGGADDLAHTVGLAGADVDVPVDGVARLHDLFFRSAHQLQDFLRPFPQQHTVLGQGDLPAAPDHQLFAQLLLQLLELPGEGGLGQVEEVSRRRDILLPGHGQKVLQHSQFHCAHLWVYDNMA